MLGRRFAHRNSMAVPLVLLLAGLLQISTTLAAASDPVVDQETGPFDIEAALAELKSRSVRPLPVP